jgi:hypothetical protein
VTDKGSDIEQGFYWETIYDIFQCCGCDAVVLRRSHSFSENDGEVTTFYPPPISRWSPLWLWSIPADIRQLVIEVYIALQADSLSLAIMGARAVVEVAMINKVGDCGSFNQNLDAMEKQNYISRNNKEYLATALDAGSAAIHRGHRPDEDDLNRVMDIVENFLHSIYVLGGHAKQLKANTPPRPKK